MLLFVSCAYAGSVSWGQRLRSDVQCNRVGELAACVKRDLEGRQTSQRQQLAQTEIFTAVLGGLVTRGKHF